MPIGEMRTEEREGRWFVLWGEDQMHLHCPTEDQAIGLAIAAQWAAKKTMEKLGEK